MRYLKWQIILFMQWFSHCWRGCYGCISLTTIKNKCLVLSALALSGCSVFPRLPSTRNWHGMKPGTDEPISNAFTIASDIMMYVGIASILIGLALLIIFKRIISGGQAIIFAFSCFILSQGLSWFGSHWKMLCIVGFLMSILAGFIYYKAVVSGLPWLEKLFNKDFNRDGIVGDPLQPSRISSQPVPQPMAPADDGIELSALENPESKAPESGADSSE